MSFATGDSSSDNEDDSSGTEIDPDLGITEELDDPDTFTAGFSLTSLGIGSAGIPIAAPAPRPIERQGSPWRESPLSLAMAAEQDGWSLLTTTSAAIHRSKSSKRGNTTIKREKTIPENGVDEVDRNSMYTKGTAEVPLPSRIERKSQRWLAIPRICTS
jgi:hypothetical protein